MTTAIDIIREATENVSEAIGYDIQFFYGSSAGVESYMQRLKAGESAIYPAVIVFTEGITEIQKDYSVQFTIPKIVICCRSLQNYTELEKRELIYDAIIYPIFELLSDELDMMHQNVEITRSDLPTPNEVLNDTIEGCFIRNLSMNVEIKEIC